MDKVDEVEAGDEAGASVGDGVENDEETNIGDDSDAEVGSLHELANPLTPGYKVALRGGRHGKWCADEGNKVICNRNHILSWETFEVVDAGSGRIGLRGGRHRKMCADEGNKVVCNRNHLLSWEKFRVEDAGSGRIALRGGRNGRLCADEGHNVVCNRNAIGSWERFHVHKVSCGTACKPPEVIGKWAMVRDMSNVNVDVEITETVTTSGGSTVSNSQSSSVTKDVSTSVSAGFPIKFVSVDVGITASLSSTSSQQSTQTITSGWSNSQTRKHSANCKMCGTGRKTLFQWVVETKGYTIKTSAWRCQCGSEAKNKWQYTVPECPWPKCADALCTRSKCSRYT